MSVAIVAPTRREATACGEGTLVCGVGVAAEASLAALLDRGRAEALVIAGVCGGLDPSLAPGTLILCRRALQRGAPELKPDQAQIETARRRLRGKGVPFVLSGLLTVEHPVASRAEKTDLWNEFGAAGVDMETYPLARLAEARGVPWLAVRAVLDPANAGLPAVLRNVRDEVDERALAAALARSPRDWPAAARLALWLRCALAGLRQGVPVVAAVASSVRPLRGVAAEESRLIVLE
jgi:nucleoside phosphorylase